LADWLAVRGTEPGPLFVALDRGAPSRGERWLDPQTVRDVVAWRAAEAGGAPLRPHDLRRTFISELLDAGVDLALVQKLAGHSDPQITSSYDRRAFGARRTAVARLDVPA
jgi:integrase/recombinase XerD